MQTRPEKVCLNKSNSICKWSLTNYKQNLHRLVVRDLDPLGDRRNAENAFAPALLRHRVFLLQDLAVAAGRGARVHFQNDLLAAYQIQEGPGRTELHDS